MTLHPDTLRNEFDQIKGELRAFLEMKLPRDVEMDLTADDLLQEVWLTATTRLDTIRDPASIASWLRRITHRKLIDALRVLRSNRRGGGRRISGDHSPNTSRLAIFRRLAAVQRTPSSLGAVREAEEAVKSALGGLPDEYRRAMTLYYIDGLSRDRIAAAMTRTPAAVNAMLYRGLLMLRGVLGPSDKYFSRE